MKILKRNFLPESKTCIQPNIVLKYCTTSLLYHYFKFVWSGRCLSENVDIYGQMGLPRFQK